MAGSFYFAWVDAAETTFDAFAHARGDEDIVSLSVEQAEGEFAALTLAVRNPRVGLLSASRKVWAWLSYDDSSSDAPIPLFFGRLVGLPDDLIGEVVTLQFSARPADYVARKGALAETLKVAPYWDEVFVAADRRDDPDAVLEARSALWAIDRVTHAVTISDVLVGEDGIAEFAPDEVPYDSVSVKLGTPPAAAITGDATVTWTQAAAGELLALSRSSLATVSASALAAAWPKPGASLGGGWSVKLAAATCDLDDIPDDAFTTEIQRVAPPKPLSDEDETVEPVPEPPTQKIGRPIPPGWGLIITKFEARGSSGGKAPSGSLHEEGLLIPYTARCFGSLVLGYEAKRARKETVRFTLSADVQPVTTLPEDDEPLTLSVSGGDVGEPIGADLAAAAPIGDVARRSYFPTERGQQSLAHLVLLARAHLALRARAVEVSFSCRFERAIELSCRQNALLHDPRLPGGQALGKITRYGFSADGDSGELIGSVTIGCAVGRGGAIAEVPGDPAYVDDGYVADGYQFCTGNLVAIGAGDVGYTVPADAPNDDGLVFPLRGIPWHTRPSFTPSVVPGFASLFSGGDPQESIAVKQETLENYFASCTARYAGSIKSVTGGPYVTTYELAVSDLKLPAMIDLEASA